MPKIHLPTPLRPVRRRRRDRRRARAAPWPRRSRRSSTRHAGLRAHLFDEAGSCAPSSTSTGTTRTSATSSRRRRRSPTSDALSIVPSIAGGCLRRRRRRSAALSNEEIRRYARHLIMPEVGLEGQTKLKAARVLVVGAGGLGSPLAALPRGGRRRHARPRRLRRRGRVEPAAPDPLRDARTSAGPSSRRRAERLARTSTRTSASSRSRSG